MSCSNNTTSKSLIMFCEQAQNYSRILLSSTENIMIFIVNFLSSNPDLRFRTYSVALFWYYQDKVNNFILVLYSLPFNTLAEDTLSLDCTRTLQYIFALLVQGRHVHITNKDTLQRIIHVDFELSYINQIISMNHTITHIVLWLPIY
jgi:hypothetical protein